LKRLVGSVQGAVSGSPNLRWSEGVAVRLDWANDRSWLVFEPRLVFDGLSADNAAAAADFGRERTVKRYNRQLNDLVAFLGQLESSASQKQCPICPVSACTGLHAGHAGPDAGFGPQHRIIATRLPCDDCRHDAAARIRQRRDQCSEPEHLQSSLPPAHIRDQPARRTDREHRRQG
jgi:hypothetical protein